MAVLLWETLTHIWLFWVLVSFRLELGPAKKWSAGSLLENFFECDTRDYNWIKSVLPNFFLFYYTHIAHSNMSKIQIFQMKKMWMRHESNVFGSPLGIRKMLHFVVSFDYILFCNVWGLSYDARLSKLSCELWNCESLYREP